MPLAEAQEYLRASSTRGASAKRLMMGSAPSSSSSFYQQPRVLAVLDIDWAGRAEALTRRRAELLR
jgi:hypothetical protein